MALMRDELFRREAEGMSDRDWQSAEDKNDTNVSITIDEEAVPSLLQEKREREELSRRIAFGEGL